jgi:hypothetical protein
MIFLFIDIDFSWHRFFTFIISLRLNCYLYLLIVIIARITFSSFELLVLFDLHYHIVSSFKQKLEHSISNHQNQFILVIFINSFNYSFLFGYSCSFSYFIYSFNCSFSYSFITYLSFIVFKTLELLSFLG